MRRGKGDRAFWGKGDRLLHQNLENVCTAHRQAYHYFINIPLKPESEWQDIEDIKPLIRAHYHAYQANDLEAANAIIAEVYKYMQQWNCAEDLGLNLLSPLLTETHKLKASVDE